MLVLSRRPNEEIVFPHTGIRLRILRFSGNAVRIGIDAPPEVEILRHELATARGEEVQDRKPIAGSHALRNKLNKVSLGLYRYQQQSQAGQLAEADATFRQVLECLESLDRDWPLLGSGAAKPPAQPSRFRTLLVEDDANERELLAGILGMNGCECASVGDGQDALDYLGSHELPDFLLLDMGLPRLSGPQILERLRRDPRYHDLKVLVISGTPAAELGLEDAAAAGVASWFSKPLNPRRLWEAMQQRLKSPHERN